MGDEEYRLSIEYKNKKTSSARIVGNEISLSISDNMDEAAKREAISKLASRCVGARRKPELRRTIDRLNKKHFGKKVNKIFFKNMKSRWGSCSAAGNINISTRLLFAPPDVLEYVCIHELAHLKEMSHSPRFWALVEEAMPDYREKRDWLRKNGSDCCF